MTGLSEDSAALADMTPEEMAENLASSSRKLRQSAASGLAELSRENPEQVLPFVEVVVDSLKRPEARTRWESLDVLSNLVSLDCETCSGSVELVEESLFDENNGTVRLAAMRFLCKLGACSSDLAEVAWPLIDEALQCYHGDPEYTDMLLAVTEFAQSNLPEVVADGLVERMQFDANNPKSGLLRRANSIIEAAQSREQ